MFDDRFARQKRFELPSGFPLTSPYTGIVHHLSGPNLIAKSQTSLKRSKSDDCAKQKNPISYFHYAYKFTTRTLAMEFDSLVRVSRRVEKNHLVFVLQLSLTPSSPLEAVQSRTPPPLPDDSNA